MRQWLPLLGLLLLSSPALAQDRDTKVRHDRETFQASKNWIYNDLGEGIRAARASGKPLLVVFRCIPCVACQKFDDDVARRDPIIRDLLDDFVCVRIVQANTIDLTVFQHDFDQSFAVYLMNPDLTIYGRFGTRSERPEYEDISLQGLRKAMESALRMHRDYAAVKPSLVGKQVKTSRFKSPRDYPSLSGKYGESLNYEGQVTKSCMHCHQIREAERLVYRAVGEPIPDEVLLPYPDPSVLGLKLDPKETATLERVAPGSIAERAGLRPGDNIVALAGQPLLSIADVQWVLHKAPASTQLSAQMRRGSKTWNATLNLQQGWRLGDISWRASTWDLRRMGLGGMRLDDLTDEERKSANLPHEGMALRVRHLGEYGEHAIAKRAGFQKGDVLVMFDGLNARMSESEVLVDTLRRKRPGESVAAKVLRNGQTKALKFALQ
jgi:serine protease Do